jgi:urease accessory protein
MPRLALLAVLPAAGAHAGMAAGQSAFLAGLAHPVFGTVHLAATMAIGVFAAMSGKTARWAYPASYIAGMIVGGIIGPVFAAVGSIGLASAAVLGAVAVALASRTSTGGACAALGLFGVAHGCTHGCESLTAGGLPFAAGFLVTTSALMGIGLLLGFAIGYPERPGLARALGAFACLAGLAVAMG